MKFAQFITEAVSKKEIIKQLSNTKVLGYIGGNKSGGYQPNWTDKTITDKMAMKLLDDGIISWNQKDDIYILAKWIDPKTGDYNSKFNKTFGK